uniref:Uncharacterized protein n=1 Tax=Anguilla anguilla TaxID=7936 RepID=A0A0E9XU70_ANGAN
MLKAVMMLFIQPWP